MLTPPDGGMFWCHLDIAQLLLQSGVEFNNQTPEGWAALHVAVWACAPAVARLLLRSGANPNVKYVDILLFCGFLIH